MADTTTATRVPFAASFATNRAALLTRSLSRRLDPPNLTTSVFEPGFNAEMALCLISVRSVVVVEDSVRVDFGAGWPVEVTVNVTTEIVIPHC